MKKNIENRLMPTSRPTTLAPRRVRRRKIENGINGQRSRSSITTKAASSSTAAASSSTVEAEPQPALTASTSAYTSSDSPAVTVIAPGKSNDRCASSILLSTSKRGASAAALTPIGTFTNSTQRQLRPL